MKQCEIHEVKNGWIVRTGRPDYMIDQSDRDTLVFNDSLTMGKWVERYFYYATPEKSP